MIHRWAGPALLAAWLFGCPTAADDDATGDDDAADDDTADDDAGDDDSTSGDQPPTAPVVEIDPPFPAAYAPLQCLITTESVDPEGYQVSYGYRWYRDGALHWCEEPVLPSGETQEGEVWDCVVTPSDPFDVGPPGQATVTVGEPVPQGSRYHLRFEATGDPLAGDAHVWLDMEYLDFFVNPMCTVRYEFDATFLGGPGQGDDFWISIDETLAWTSGALVGHDCDPAWVMKGKDWVEWFRWYLHPTAFVSCDGIASDKTLSSTFLGDDPLELGSDGTFGSFCEDLGPAYAAKAGTGPMEAMWLGMGNEGDLDALGNYAYFVPADTTNVGAWLIYGVLMADASNTYEPGPGLSGLYVGHSFWLYIYGY